MSLSEYDRHPENLIERVKRLERRLEEMARWAHPLGGIARIKPPAAYMATSETSLANIPNNSATTVSNMTEVLYADGLLVDDGGQWIEFVRNRDGEYYHIFAYAKWESNGTGYREIRMQLYDSAAGIWGSDRIMDRVEPVSAGAETIHTGYFLFRLLDLKYTRVRFQVRQTSGGFLILPTFICSVLAGRLP